MVFANFTKFAKSIQRFCENFNIWIFIHTVARPLRSLDYLYRLMGNALKSLCVRARVEWISPVRNGVCLVYPRPLHSKKSFIVPPTIPKLGVLLDVFLFNWLFL